MSRFNEICESYHKLLKAAEGYEIDCRNLAKNIVTGFIDYLECGRNDLEIKQFELKDDGYYHCLIQLTVYEGLDKHANKGLVPEIILKLGRDRNDFILKTSAGNRVFAISKEELNNPQSESLVKFYDYLFTGIRSYYESPVEEFVHNNMSGIIKFG